MVISLFAKSLDLVQINHIAVPVVIKLSQWQLLTLLLGWSEMKMVDAIGITRVGPSEIIENLIPSAHVTHRAFN